MQNRPPIKSCTTQYQALVDQELLAVPAQCGGKGCVGFEYKKKY